MRFKASFKYSPLCCVCFNLFFRYEAVYAKKLPECIAREGFINKYTDHNDTVTVIDPKCTYAVKAPTKHPIYENFRVEVSSYRYVLQFFSNYIDPAQAFANLFASPCIVQ